VRRLGRALLELVAPSVCPACDLPRSPGDTLLCGDCARALRPLARVRAVHTALAYEGTGMELVRRFKFEGRRDALEVLAHALVRRARALPFDAIAPVPRHLERVRREGREPTLALARALGRALGVPVLERALERSRATPPQTGLSVAARRANVAGSFRAGSVALAGRRVLLLDDVATTGATLVEAARALRAVPGPPRRIVLAAAAGTPGAVL
jgi:ComF family protein